MNKIEMAQEVARLFQQGNTSLAFEKIETAKSQGVDLREFGVTFANLGTAGFQWDAMSNLIPQGTNFFETSGWVRSLIDQRPVNSSGEPIPWFTYPSIDFLEGFDKSQWDVFEWGGGNSTKWWASRVNSIVTVEDNAEWFNEIKTQLPDTVNLVLQEGEDAYSGFINCSEDMYDVIVVDGSYRVACAREAVKHIKYSGIIVFDNSDVENHAEAQRFLTEQGFYRMDFWGLIPSYLYKNCTSIYFKNPEFLRQATMPHTHTSSVGLSCSQAINQG